LRGCITKPITASPISFVVSTKVEMDISDAFASIGSPGHQLNTMLGLTGEANNPPTPSGSNSPGLDSQTEVAHAPKGNAVKSHHWIIIVLIVLAIFAGWYFWGGSGA
jgi:hypothetical protein